MKFTVSLKENYEFRRLYAKGKNAAASSVAVYFRRRKGTGNRLGLTVGKKIGGAVVRNRIRRRLREIYRLHEDRMIQGCDIVLVARTRAAFCSYAHLNADFVKTVDKLGLLRKVPVC